MRKCKRCEVSKPLVEFSNDKRKLEGKNTMCKLCSYEQRKAFREENKERLAEEGRLWRRNNKEKLVESRAKYYMRHKEESKTYRADNIERINAKQKEYRENNREKRNHQVSEWAKDNKDYCSLRQKEYRKTQKGKMVTIAAQHKRAERSRDTCDGSVTTMSLVELLEYQNNKCYHCSNELDHDTRRAVHLDHLIPLSKGGTHTLDNVVWSCACCNLTKSDKFTP